MTLFRSLKSRLIWGTCAALLAVLVVGGMAIYKVVEQRLRSQFDQSLSDKLKFFQASCFVKESGNIAFGMLSDDWDRLQDPVDPDFFQYRFTNGNLIYRSRNLHGSDLPAAVTSEGTGLQHGETDLPGGIRGRYASANFFPLVRSDDQFTGERSPDAVNIAVAHDASIVAGALKELGAVLGSVGACLALVILGVTWLLTHTGLRPLGRLREQIDTIPIGQPERFTADGMPAELAPIIVRLNALMDRVGTTLQHEREFTANVAHELRTPLAVMRAQLESLLRDDSLSFAAELQVREALSTEDELERSVENLLWLARLDRGLDRFDNQEVEVGRFMRTCWRPFLDAADAKELKIEWNLRKAPRVDCSPDLLRVMLRNLYENAVAYTPTNGKISISGSNGMAPVTICITNTCENLRSSDLQGLFGRRDCQPTIVHSAHSRLQPAKLGIGLALCRRIAGVLGGELTATLTEKDQVQFRFQLSQETHSNN